jgi:copper chaperone CopZ
VAIRTETIEVSGIRCERCVMRLGATLRDLDGLEAANANLVGQVTLSWNDDLTDREAILARLAQSGFRRLDTEN